MHCRIFTVFYLLLMNAAIVHAQQFGGNPSSVKWRQINTDTARIIFPEGLDTTAGRIASVIHELQKSHNESIGKTLRKVNIVLQNQTTVSNAYVGLAPYRSEFYLFSPQNSFELGSLNWADNLAVHEYRHVQQYSNFNVGLSRFFSFILGQEGQAVANSASVPDWFFEGDAVFNETSLTMNGRGRLPDFFKNYQSLFYSGKYYSFMKLRNGSLRHFIPGHYELGYMLVAYGREKYGADVWKKITHDAASFKPLFYPLQGALKRYTGESYSGFVKNALQFYQNQWKGRAEPRVNWITPVRTNNVTDYRYPYVATDGSYIVLKRSYRQIPAFVRIDATGKEKKLGTRDIAYDDYFSFNNEKIIYASLKPDVRWGYREYSDLKVLDVQNGRLQKITSRRKLFSPDISHNGQMIVAVEMKPDQVSSLAFMDPAGKLLFTFHGSQGEVFAYPKFSADDKSVYFITKNSKGLMSLQKKIVEDKSSNVAHILPFRNRIIGFPVVQGDTVLFSSSSKGSDEAWAYIEKSNAVYRLATYPTGLYQSAINGGNLVASAFTSDGYRIASFPASSLLWQKIDENENMLPDLYATDALKQEDKQTLGNIIFRKFKTTRYRKTTNLLNFHSWRPYFDDPDFSFTIYGQNIINTLRTEIYYAYNTNEQSNKAGANAVYGGWYIQPFIGASQTWQRNVRYNADTSFFYNELNANAGLQLPLNFSGGKQYRYLQLSSSLNRQQLSWTGLGKKLLNDRRFNYLQTGIYYSAQVQKAAQHIYPHWAQTLSMQYRATTDTFTARQFLGVASFYLPGFHPTHNIVLAGAYQSRDTMNRYLFSNNFPFSRGYVAIDFPRMWRFGANYHFPLFYPDWGFGNIVYFKRIRANAYYDYTFTKSLRAGTKYSFNTAGGEIYFDTKWWNQQDVSFGIRYCRLLNKEYRGVTQPNQWEIILPVNLLSN